MQTAGWRLPFEVSKLSQHSPAGGPPPVPLEAHLTASGRLFTCFFDRDLRDWPINDANWRARAFSQNIDIHTCHVHGSQVRAFARVVGPAPAGERCSYLATPPDVQSQTWVPAERFIGFPLQVFG